MCLDVYRYLSVPDALISSLLQVSFYQAGKIFGRPQKAASFIVHSEEFLEVENFLSHKGVNLIRHLCCMQFSEVLHVFDVERPLQVDVDLCFWDVVAELPQALMVKFDLIHESSIYLQFA